MWFKRRPKAPNSAVSAPKNQIPEDPETPPPTGSKAETDMDAVRLQAIISACEGSHGFPGL